MGEEGYPVIDGDESLPDWGILAAPDTVKPSPLDDLLAEGFDCSPDQ